MPLPSKQKGPGRPGGRFTQHRRLDKLREVLEANPNGLDIASLASLLRVTTRSVRRYLQELDVKTEVESVPTRPGGANVWRIKPSERGRTVTLRRTQAYGLLAARPLFETLRGSALFDEIDVVMRQLLVVAQRPTRAGVKGEVPGDLRLDERFVAVAKAPRPAAARGEEMDEVFQAVANCRVLRFRYRGDDGKVSPDILVLEPYALVLLDGQPVCIGRERSSGDLRRYLVDRMSATSVSTRETFVLPADFNVQRFIHGPLGMGSGTPTRVILEFDPRAADELRGLRIHPSQKVATAPDGRMRVSLMVYDLEAAARWVRGFGASAHVVEPAELARLVAHSLRAALARYGDLT